LFFKAKANQKHYKHEMTKYKAKKALTDLPKKPLHGFMHFSKEKCENLKADHPKWKMEKISKALGKAWGKMSSLQH
jgi:16S rRNA C967 or C1407 C5-methylase (RsmB/RsmF family)